MQIDMNTFYYLKLKIHEIAVISNLIDSKSLLNLIITSFLEKIYYRLVNLAGTHQF